jgi:hypothetical protein
MGAFAFNASPERRHGIGVGQGLLQARQRLRTGLTLGQRPFQRPERDGFQSDAHQMGNHGQLIVQRLAGHPDGPE